MSLRCAIGIHEFDARGACARPGCTARTSPRFPPRGVAALPRVEDTPELREEVTDAHVAHVGQSAEDGGALIRLAWALGVGVEAELVHDARDELRISWPGVGTFVVSATELRLRWEQ